MSDYCTDTVPVLLRRSTFCRAFAADAKDFRSYNSWVRAKIKTGLEMSEVLRDSSLSIGSLTCLQFFSHV
jgi:hypothetical protein